MGFLILTLVVLVSLVLLIYFSTEKQQSSTGGIPMIQEQSELEEAER